MFKRVLKTIGMCMVAIALGTVAQLLALKVGDLMADNGLPQVASIAAASVLYPLLTFISIWLAFGKGFKCDLKRFRITKPNFKFYWIGVAIVLPLIVTAVYQFMSGHWTMCDQGNVLALTTNGILFTGLAAGISEELIFRGAIMGSIEKHFNTKAAVIIPSALFALVHIAGRSLDLVSILLLMAAGTLVGVMFSLIEIESKSFWNNALVHAVWNMVILGILHTDAAPSDSYVFTYVLDSKSMLITGGDFGIEASLVATVAYFAVTVIAAVLMLTGKSQSKAAKGLY